MAQKQKSTGKHGHKDTQEPWPHHQQSGDDDKSEQRSAQVKSGSRTSGNGDKSLKGREYKDASGNIHHHTRTYQEQHGKK
jgi:hypothetical protein